MMFLAPGFLYASIAVAAAVVALHFIATRQPRAGMLPTVRFIPDLPATATARATRPSDLLLMLLRAAIVLAVGAALAKPVLKPSRGVEASVILVDISRSARDSLALRDSVRAVYRARDAVVLFDSSARIVATGAADSLEHLTPGNARGNLSAALVAALRAASSLRDRADSIALVIVSPFAAEEFDAATNDARSLWPGRARLVRVAAPIDTTIPRVSRASLELSARAGDPLQYAIAEVRVSRDATGLIVRNGASGVATEGALIDWPVSSRPQGAVARLAPDTVGAVIAGDAIVVSAFERRWSYPADSIRNAEVIARWVDGEPAAIETRRERGCARSVAVPVAAVGDLVISRDFTEFVSRITGSCIEATATAPAPPARVAALSGRGSLAPRSAFKPRPDVRSTLQTWLIGFAVIAALAEMPARRLSSRSAKAAPIRREAGSA